MSFEAPVDLLSTHRATSCTPKASSLAPTAQLLRCITSFTMFCPNKWACWLGGDSTRTAHTQRRCVCVCLCVHVYDVYLYLHVYMCVQVCLQKIYSYIYMCVVCATLLEPDKHVCLCVYLCVYRSSYLYQNVYMCVHPHVKKDTCKNLVCTNKYAHTCE